MESAVGIIIVAGLVLYALSSRRWAQKSLGFLFWVFIALVVLLVVSIIISVW